MPTMRRPKRIYDEAGVGHDSMQASSKAESSVQFPLHNLRKLEHVSGGQVSQASLNAVLSVQLL